MKRKSIIALLMSLMLVSMTFIGCGNNKEIEPVDRQPVVEETDQETEQEEIPDDGRFHGKWIVDVEYASGRVGAEDTLFIDARGEGQAILGTVEGAIATGWQAWSITEGSAGDEKWGCIQEPDDLEKTLGNHGVSKDKEIIIVGETVSGWGDDARLVWTLLAAGYTDVKMIDGGYGAWKAYDAPTQFLASKPEAAEVSIDELDYSHVMTTQELKDHYDNYVIVDVRTKDEYDGAVLYNEAKGGHLPGALHIPYTELFQEDGTLKPNKELIKMFEDAGLTAEDAIVTYCTGGIRSAYMQLVLEMCGFEQSYNYDQSFWRWAVVGDVEK